MTIIASTRRLPFLAVAAALALGACRGDAPRAAEPETASAAADQQRLDDHGNGGGLEEIGDLFIADETEDRTRPPRVYHDLTRHDWYARGEPLMHEGRSYPQSGAPAAIRGARLELAGEYGGVDYYRLPGDPRDALYVPVYESYWLPFRAAPDTAPR
jgi:hypothetical protein